MTNNKTKVNSEEKVSDIVKDNFFVVSRPESTNSLREIFVARYPNNK